MSTGGIGQPVMAVDAGQRLAGHALTGIHKNDLISLMVEQGFEITRRAQPRARLVHIQPSVTYNIQH
jgi:hypothetical protein